MNQQKFTAIISVLVFFMLVAISFTFYQICLIEKTNTVLQRQVYFLQQKDVLHEQYFTQIDNELFGINLWLNKNYRPFIQKVV